MGLNLITFVEISPKQPSERGHLVASFYFSRDYDLFRAITENRRFHAGGTRPVFAERGLPSDTSMVILEEFEDGLPDNINPSWLYAEELETILPRTTGETAELLKAVIGAMESLNDGQEEKTRFVFWLR